MIKTNACTQFLVAIKIYILCFLKKLLFRYTPLLSRLVLSSHMGDKLHICWKDWCHQSLLYTLPVTSLNTKLWFSSTVNNKSRKWNRHTYPKNNTDYFTHPPRTVQNVFSTFSLRPLKADPSSETLPRGSCSHPWMGELRPYSSQVWLWFRKELFFAIDQHWTGCPSFLSCGGENLFSMNNLLHAPVEGDVFQFGHR